MNGNTDSRSLRPLDPVENKGLETQSSLVKEEGEEKEEANDYSLGKTLGLEEGDEKKHDNFEYYSPEAKRLGLVEEFEETNEGRDSSTEAKSLGERMRREVRTRLGRVGDEVFDEDNSAEVQILEEEEVVRGTRGLGGLWKLSLYVTLSFATYVLLSGPHIEPNWIPNITERDPIPKIYRARNRSSSSSSPSR